MVKDRTEQAISRLRAMGAQFECEREGLCAKLRIESPKQATLWLPSGIWRARDNGQDSIRTRRGLSSLVAYLRGR